MAIPTRVLRLLSPLLSGHQTLDTLRACLHGGGGPQVGDLTRLGEVINPPVHIMSF